MTSRSKNFNLSKEPFEGYVRHWKRQWVHFGDKAREHGTWTLKLIKWVQTEARVSSGSVRHPHISPVTNLSLVPGGRLNSGTTHRAQPNGQQSLATADQQANASAADQLSQPPANATLPQQQQQQQYHQELPPLPGTVGAAATTFISTGTAAAAAAAASGRPNDSNLVGVSSFYMSSLEAPSSSQHDMTAAAAAAAMAGSGLIEGTSGFALPSPSAGTGGVAFSFEQMQGSQLQLATTGSDFASIVPGASSAGGAASGYTAGTDRTDSDALGRLPHLQRPAASEYTDSMDVDLGTSHGGASQQLTRDSGDLGDELDSGDDEGDEQDEQPDVEASEDDHHREDDDADDDDGDEFVDDDSGDGYDEGCQEDGDDSGDSDDDEGAAAEGNDYDGGIDDEDMP